MLFCVRSLVSASAVLALAFTGPVLFARAQVDDAVTGQSPTRDMRADAEHVLSLVHDGYVVAEDVSDRDGFLAGILMSLSPDDVETVDDLAGFVKALSLRLRDPLVAIHGDKKRSYDPATTPDVSVDVFGETIEVVDVRAQSAAAEQGVRPGCRLVTLNGQSIDDAIADMRIAYDLPYGPETSLHIVQRLLSGFSGPVEEIDYECADGPRLVRYGIGDEEGLAPSVALTTRRVGNGYRAVYFLRPNDSLQRDGFVEAWEAALEEIPVGASLIIDLRDTPSGAGMAAYAHILSSLVSDEGPFVNRVPDGAPPDPSPVERVNFVSRYPMAVIVGRWTSGEAETLALALDYVGAETFGSQMAGLSGQAETFDLPESGLRFTLPTRRVIHMDGTDRRAFYPARSYNFADAPNRRGEDGPLEAAKTFLQSERSDLLTPLKPESPELEHVKNQ